MNHCSSCESSKPITIQSIINDLKKQSRLKAQKNVKLDHCYSKKDNNNKKKSK